MATMPGADTDSSGWPIAGSAGAQSAPPAARRSMTSPRTVAVPGSSMATLTRRSGCNAGELERVDGPSGTGSS
ncbi:hypothetical protein G6F61_015119 [Rhizopus arrhizus]|nr:hypothetical protein G6F61_015119 [Rhizopus arrhizus]